jgi:WS/DGAT/MGAT family acyltransferase
VQQLSVTDTTLLNLETPTSIGHVSSVAILDPSTCPVPFTFEHLTERVAARLPALPQFRRRLYEVPLGLDRPYWIEDPDFDLDYHLRHIAVPAPGDDRRLADLVARIHERHLDRRRPLWEIYLIEGLADGRVAVLSKIHHAAIDGITGQEVLAALVDTEPDAPAVTVEDTWRPEQPPAEAGLLVRTVARSMLSPYRILVRSARLARQLPAIGPVFANALFYLGRAGSAEELIDHPGVAAPRTSFNRAIGAHRRWAFTSVPLAEVRSIRDDANNGPGGVLAHGAPVSVNDVVLAVCAGALRRWIQGRETLPERSLAALVPVSVSVRRPDGETEHRVAGTITTLATDHDDPVERLTAISEAMLVVRDHNAVPAQALKDIGQLTPPSVAALAGRLVARTGLAERFHPPFNVVIANVPGPDVPLYAAGARVVAHHPISPILDGVGMNLSVTSLGGQLDFGLIADRDLVPDLWDLAECIPAALEELRAEVAAHSLRVLDDHTVTAVRTR